jgi:hypothetical protein
MIRTVNFQGGTTATFQPDGTWSVRHGLVTEDGLTLDNAASAVWSRVQFPGAGFTPDVRWVADQLVSGRARILRESEPTPAVAHIVDTVWDRATGHATATCSSCEWSRGFWGGTRAEVLTISEGHVAMAAAYDAGRAFRVAEVLPTGNMPEIPAPYAYQDDAGRWVFTPEADAWEAGYSDADAEGRKR